MKYQKLQWTDKTKIVVILLNGGGKAPFQTNHPLVALLKQYPVNIIALELPGHGSSRFTRKITAEELVELYKEGLSKIIQELKDKELGFIGISLGGLLALKSLEVPLVMDKTKFVIGIGCGFVILEEKVPMFKKYTSLEYFQQGNMLNQILQYHKDGWQYLLESSHDWFYPTTPLLLNPSVVKNALVKKQVFLIPSEEEELFPPESNLEISKEFNPTSVYIVHGFHHFEYFTKGWEQVKKSIQTILDAKLKSK